MRARNEIWCHFFGDKKHFVFFPHPLLGKLNPREYWNIGSLESIFFLQPQHVSFAWPGLSGQSTQVVTTFPCPRYAILAPPPLTWSMPVFPHCFFQFLSVVSFLTGTPLPRVGVEMRRISKQMYLFLYFFYLFFFYIFFRKFHLKMQRYSFLKRVVAFF